MNGQGPCVEPIEISQVTYRTAHLDVTPHSSPRAILRRLRAGEATVPEIVEAVYVGLSPGLRWAAAQSVLAHLIELVRLEQVECGGPPTTDRRYRLRRGPRGQKYAKVPVDASRADTK